METIFIFLPALLYVIVFTLIKQWTKSHRRAVSIAMNVTTVSLIAAVHFLIIAIWAKSLLSMIVLFMLIVAMIFTYIYWKKREEIIYHKLFVGYWRLSFLLFTIFYLGLLVYATALRVIAAFAGA